MVENRDITLATWWVRHLARPESLALPLAANPEFQQLILIANTKKIDPRDPVLSPDVEEILIVIEKKKRNPARPNIDILEQLEAAGEISGEVLATDAVSEISGEQEALDVLGLEAPVEQAQLGNIPPEGGTEFDDFEPGTEPSFGAFGQPISS